MPEIRSTFTKGRMNLDLDEKLLPNGEYRGALNIEVSTSDSDDVGSAQIVMGNVEINTGLNLNWSQGLQCVGSIADEKNNVAYWFVVNDAATKSMIFRVYIDNTGIFAVDLIVSDLDNTSLEFDKDNYITAINIVDDLLFWSDGVNEPKKINIKDFDLNNPGASYSAQSIFYVNGVNKGQFNKDHITVIKKKPKRPLTVETVRGNVILQTGTVVPQDASQPNYGPDGFIESFPVLNFQNLDVGETTHFYGELAEFLVLDPGGASTYDPDQDGNADTYTDLAGNSWGPSQQGSGLTYKVFDSYPLALNQGDILLMSDPAEIGVLPGNAQVRVRVVSVDYRGGGIPDAGVGAAPTRTEMIYADIEVEILQIDSSTPTDISFFDFMIEDLSTLIFQKDFPRFAYRYKYKDGEYSAFSPFTQAVFNTSEFNIHPTREPYNTAMQNNVKKIILKDFVTSDIPEDVVEIDLLYKPDNSAVVYSIDTIKPLNEDGTDSEAWHTIDGGVGFLTIGSSTYPANHTGYYEITSDVIYAAIPENQLLRSYDNVPKKAKAQEFTAGRLMYGNYTQNLNLLAFDNELTLGFENRTFGQDKDFDFTYGLKSIKSQRTYQAGVVILDRYARETPVLTSGNTSSLFIPYDITTGGGFEGSASASLRLIASKIPIIRANTNSSTSNVSNPNNEPYFFKFYVKNIDSEYYNLVLDRVYRAEEDGNLWLSFPSSDRNKLQEDDFIILKKALEQDTQVEIDNKFKVIAIENEAPDFIRLKYRPIGEVAGNDDLFTDASFRPAEDIDTLIIDKQTLINNGVGDIQEIFNKNQEIALAFKIPISGGETLHSQVYNITSLVTQSANPSDYYVLKLDKPIESRDAWVETDDSVLNPNLLVNFFYGVTKQWEEFQGRFFVKIKSDLVTAQYLEPHLYTGSNRVLDFRQQIFSLRDSLLLERIVDGQNPIAGDTTVYDTGTISNVGTSTSSKSSSPENWIGGATQTSKPLFFFGEQQVRSGWFIDELFTRAQQPTVAPNLTNAFFAQPFRTGLISAPTPNDLTFDVSCSGNLFVGRNLGISGNVVTLESGTTVSSTSPNNRRAAVGGTVDGLPGISQTDDSNEAYSNSPFRSAWKKQITLSHGFNTNTFQHSFYKTNNAARNFNGTNGSPGLSFANVDDNLESVYNSTYSTPSYFMHLSFGNVGTQLHDGTNLLAQGSVTSVIGNGSSYDAYGIDNNALWDLQGIFNFNTQSGVVSQSDPAIDFVIPGYQITKTTDEILAAKNQWNPAGHVDLGNFDPKNQQLINNLVAGGQFKFSNDANNTIFTIRNVTVKRLYNHTSWNASVEYFAGSNEFQESTRSVHYRWWRFVNASGNTQKNDRFDALQNQLRNFSAPDNRRVCYILELDKDPRVECSIDPTTLDGPSSNYLTTSGFGDNDDQTFGSTFLEFTKPYVERGVTVISENPAVFETEPKENVDLDIYYEDSNTYPVVLDMSSEEITEEGYNYEDPDNTKAHMFAPVGTRVRCTRASANKDGSGDFIENFVTGWDGNILTVFPGFYIPDGIASPTLYDNNGNITAASEAALIDQSSKFFSKGLQFYDNESDSYVQYTLNTKNNSDGINFSILFISPNTRITKLKINRRITKVGLKHYNCFSFGNGVESNRIRDDFNKPFIKTGVRASTTIQEPYIEDNRSSGIIYSGIYNKNTSLNNLNQFIMAEKITKDLLPTYGSIQKLFARDSDLIALCEDKIVQIPADKDIIFNADGNPQLTVTDKVLGQSRPFVGEFGISKNPESFASSSYRAYFTDKQRGAVLRLSMDGLTPISDAGMKDWFRDKLKGDYYRIIGSYDTNKNDYNITFDSGNEFEDDADTLDTSNKWFNNFKDFSESITVTYKESVKGWSSFKSFIQEGGVNVNNTYITFREGQPYMHTDLGIDDHGQDNNTMRGVFYNKQFPNAKVLNAYITPVLNESPLSIKNFNTLNYIGDEGWICKHLATEKSVGVNSITPIDASSILQQTTDGSFTFKEDKWFSTIIGVSSTNRLSTNNEYENVDLIDKNLNSFLGIGNAKDSKSLL